MHSYDSSGAFRMGSVCLLWGRLWCEAGHLLLCGNCGSRVRRKTIVKDLKIVKKYITVQCTVKRLGKIQDCNFSCKSAEIYLGVSCDGNVVSPGSCS